MGKTMVRIVDKDGDVYWINKEAIDFIGSYKTDYPKITNSKLRMRNGTVITFNMDPDTLMMKVIGT